MKLITAIVSRSDEKEITSELIKGSFSVTKISTTGGFMKKGHTTLISVCNAPRVPLALEIIKKTAKACKYEMGAVSPEMRVLNEIPKTDSEQAVAVGGATVFVMNVEESYKF